METLLITFKERKMSLAGIAEQMGPDAALDRGGRTLVVQEGNSRLYIYEACVEDEDNEAFGQPCICIDYSNVPLVKKALEKIADSPDLTVFNDFGTILPGDQYVRRIREEVGWNWVQV